MGLHTCWSRILCPSRRLRWRSVVRSCWYCILLSSWCLHWRSMLRSRRCCILYGVRRRVLSISWRELLHCAADAAGPRARSAARAEQGWCCRGIVAHVGSR